MKKKIVLFFPSIGKLYLPIIPFAFLYLERAVRDLDVEIVIIDENVGDEYVDYIKEHKEEILLVGVSAIIGMQIESCVIFSKYVKSISNIKVLWGGWLPTTIPEQILKEEYIDFVIAGQGEMPFRSFVISLLNNESYENIKGLGFKNNNIIKVNPSEKFSFHPKFHQVNLKLVDVKKYFFEPTGTHCYSATIGCNLKCTFCTTGNVYNHNWYHKDIQQIISDLKYFKQETPSFRHLSLEDDNFFANKKFVIEFSLALISENIDIAWTASGHSHTILLQYTDEDMELIYRSGCRGVYCGAESGDKNILTLLNKKATIEDNLNYVKFLTKHNILPSFSLMAFIPVNPRKELRLSSLMITKAHLINPSFYAIVNYYTPCPNTGLYKIALENGYTFPENNEKLIEALKNGFPTPWVKRRDELWLILLKYFYYRFSDPNYYKKISNHTFIDKSLNKIFYNLIKFRAYIGVFNFPIEAIIYITILKIITKEDLYKNLFDEASSIRKVPIQ